MTSKKSAFVTGLMCQVIHLLMELLGDWWRFRRWSLIEATSHQLGDFVWHLAPGLFMSLSLGYCELGIFIPLCFLSHNVLPHHCLPALELADTGLKHSNPEPNQVHRPLKYLISYSCYSEKIPTNIPNFILFYLFSVQQIKHEDCACSV